MKKIASTIAMLIAIHFTIDLLGTPHFDDVGTIQNGLERADGVESIHVSRSNRNFVRLEGIATCERKQLLNDLNGLAQDRFEVEVEDKTDGSIIITLRKKPAS
jgi:hypothetical protein